MITAVIAGTGHPVVFDHCQDSCEAWLPNLGYYVSHTTLVLR